MQLRKKGGFWAVINPPAHIKYFKTKKEAEEYMDMITAPLEEKADEEEDPFQDFYMEK